MNKDEMREKIARIIDPVAHIYSANHVERALQKADAILDALSLTEEWRPFKDFSQIEENTTYEVTDGNHHWFAQKEWFDDDTDGGWLFSPCLRNGEDDWREDEPIIDSEGRNSITHFKPVNPLPSPPGGDNG